MKKLLPFLSIIALLCVASTCNPQRVTYNTIASVQATGQAAVDGYYNLTISGSLPTNDIPRVSHAFNVFQDSVLLATDAAAAGTNALAPGSLILELKDLQNLINTIEKKGK
jgi:predicted nuclease with TOPRIM domain